MLVLTVGAALSREWWMFGVGALAVASMVAVIWMDGRSKSAAATPTSDIALLHACRVASRYLSDN